MASIAALHMASKSEEAFHLVLSKLCYIHRLLHMVPTVVPLVLCCFVQPACNAQIMSFEGCELLHVLLKLASLLCISQCNRCFPQNGSLQRCNSCSTCGLRAASSALVKHDT